MKPQTQISPNGCLQACIATLINYDIHRVPNFVEAGEELIDGFPAWWQALQSWLNDRGLFFLEIKLVANFPWQPLPIPALAIFFGITAKGIKHAIVGRLSDDKFIPVFNPHPSGGGLTSIEGLGFLVPRDPVTPIRMGHALEKIKHLTGTNLIINPIVHEVNDLARYALQEPSLQDPMNGTPQSPKEDPEL